MKNKEELWCKEIRRIANDISTSALVIATLGNPKELERLMLSVDINDKLAVTSVLLRQASSDLLKCVERKIEEDEEEKKFRNLQWVGDE